MQHLEGPSSAYETKRIPIPLVMLLIACAGLGYWLGHEWGWPGLIPLSLTFFCTTWILKIERATLPLLVVLLFQSFLFIQVGDISIKAFSLSHIGLAAAVLLITRLNRDKALQYRQSLRIQQLEKDLLGLSQRMNHDLREPINGLNESLQHMLDNRRAGWNIEEMAGIRGMRERIERLSQVMEDLQKIAEVQRHLPSIQPVAMADCIEGALRRLAHPIRALKPDFQSPSEWPTVRAHAPWLEEVWFNLISNALKYGGNPPSLHLGHQKQANGDIRFWIEDNGDGIRPNNIAEFFNGLELLSPGQSEGQGLGLALVKRIIIKLGGTVGVDSTGVPGQGCRIFFTLPQ